MLVCCCSVAQLCQTLRPHGLQHARLPVLQPSRSLLKLTPIESVMAVQPSQPLSSPSPPAFNLSQASGSFQMSPLFILGGQSIGASPSASVLPKNIPMNIP